MTYRNAQRLVGAVATAAATLLYLFVPYMALKGLGFVPTLLLGAGVFVLLFILRNWAVERLDRRLRQAYRQRPETKLILDFAARVGTSFTIPDLVDAIKEGLEEPADMGAILLRSNTWEVIYQSPQAVSSDPKVLAALEHNFRDWAEDFCFIKPDYALASSNEGARGFFVVAKGFHLFVFTRLCSLIDEEAFRSLYGELRMYFDRLITVSDLFDVASLSKEWELVAATQRSFLPKTLPARAKLDLAVAYRPLINVSGDYYDAIAIDDARTLLVLGDVSGKGLAAALIMGIIVNTIRIAPDKADLPALVRSIDGAVRSMGFDDKYTVLFLGLVDTEKKTMRYVNAAMADPIIVSQTALGPKLRRLPPTMGLIGLVPLEAELAVEELPLRTDELILLCSDGVTEVTGEGGARLGDTEAFEKALLQASRFGAEDIVGSVSGLLYGFVGDAPFKDDVTILATKVGRLWD
jgi:serine phosphatase RsbU (regulator of sigma subunit)